MSTRRTIRSTKKQDQTQSDHITSHFRQKKIGRSELPGKPLGDEAPSTTSSKSTLFSASRAAVIPDQIEVETVYTQVKNPLTKSRPARALGVIPKKEQKVKAELNEKPTKEEGKKVIEPTNSIVLPSHYRRLHDSFKVCDQIASRCEGKTLTFTQLSHEVKRLSRRELPLDVFSQLLAVYPQSYKVNAKKIACVGDRLGGNRTARWEHVVKSNLDDDLTPFVAGPLLPDQPLSSQQILTASIRIPIMRDVSIDVSNRLEGWRMNCRQQVFRSLLTRRVMEAYEIFIRELNLESSVLPPSSTFLPPVLHEDFTRKIDEVCPHIEKAEIEKIPEDDNAAGSSQKGMKEFITSVDAAISELQSLSLDGGVSPSPAKIAEQSKKMTVLERIKAKRAAEEAAKMRRNPELEAKMGDLKRLIDNKLVSLIFGIMQSTAKTSMDTTVLGARMADSGKVTKEAVPSLLLRLTAAVPAHFSISSTSIGKFLKLSPDNSPATFTVVESLLKKELEECRRQSSTAGSLRSP